MSDLSRVFDVAIIGAGASGAILASHLGQDAGSRVALVDAGARAARGLAYGTPYGAHLLNVPAAKMSARTDDPDHFLRWLVERVPSADSGTFARRSLYGDYLAEVLNGGTPSRIVRVPGTAVGLTRSKAGWIVHLQDGRTVTARAVVLALGNLPPSDPLELGRSAPPQYLHDPWTPGAALGLASDAPVLLLGTGLTMVDVVLALRAEGHRGPLHALSRRGWLPQPHANTKPRPLQGIPRDVDSPVRALRWLRAQISRAEQENSDWRAVIDALRPWTTQVWRSWSMSQRASFLRHAQSLWDVHRHRMAPEVAAQIDALRSDGILTIHRGRLHALEPADNRLTVLWRPRGSEQTERLTVARVINCTGPAADYSRVDIPLVVQLRQAGWLSPDPLRLGIQTDEDGCLLGSNGQRVTGLFTLGPLRRPALWESTAIPEIREQAAALARLLGSAP